MMRRYFGVIALVCALAGSLFAQNTTTFGNITNLGVPCGAANCVYYQLPRGTPWVAVTVEGTWAGTLETATTSAPNANYANLDTVAWTALATETANGAWSVATSGATYLRVRATSWTAGTAHVTMASSLQGLVPLPNPVFPGALTASGLKAPAGGSGSRFWTTDGGSAAGGIASINGQTGPAVTFQSAGGTVAVTTPGANVVNLEAQGLLVNQIVPPAGVTNYVILYPTTNSNNNGTDPWPTGGSATSDNTSAYLVLPANSGGSGSNPPRASWGAFALPGGLTTANITAVYAVANIGTTYLGAAGYQPGVFASCADATSGQSLIFLNSVDSNTPITQYTLQFTSGTPANDLAAITCTAYNSIAGSVRSGMIQNVASIALVVALNVSYPQPTKLRAKAPLYVNTSDNVLGIGPIDLSSSGDGGVINTLGLGNGGSGGTTAPTALSNLLGNPAAGTYSVRCTSGTSCAPVSGSSSLNLTTTGTSGAATYSSGTLNIPQYQGALTLTTTGTSGAATLTGTVLNIPQYAGGGSMTWPSTPGIAVCTGTPCTAWATSLTAPSSALVGITDTQTLTNKTIDGVSPTTMSYVDPTSSVQTQLNGKQGSLGYTPTNAAVVPSTAPGAGQLLVGNSGGTAYTPVPLSGDCALSATGAITCTKSSGTLFGTGAFATIANYLTTAAAASTYATSSSPVFTGTVTTPLTTAGIVTVTSGGVLGSEAMATIAQGGTGQTTAATALAALLAPSAAGTYSVTCSSTTSCTASAASVADTTLTVGTTAVSANACSSASTVTMTGLTTTMTVILAPQSDVSGTAGWSPASTGQLYFTAWPTANTLNYKVCNPTSASITPGASTTWNVSAK